MLTKDQLVHGEYYLGRCRNAEIARWNANKQHFVYRRYKFGTTFLETIKHPDDDQIWDVFDVIEHLPNLPDGFEPIDHEEV